MQCSEARIRLTRFTNGSRANWYCSQDGGVCGRLFDCIMTA